MPLEWNPTSPAVRSLTEQLVSASSAGELSTDLELYSQLDALALTIEDRDDPLDLPFGSALYEAIETRHVEVVSALLDRHNSISRPAVLIAGTVQEVAIFDVFVALGLDANEPLSENEPPALS
ncbi:hypothetical protein MMC30_003385 [Trapelia coarctata]|nr:hypothetical protein [Trapelia coarctata]